MYIHVCSIRQSLHTSHSGHTCTETTVQLGSLQYLVPVLEYGDTSIIKICQYSCSIYVGQYTANLNTNSNYFMLYMSAFSSSPSLSSIIIQTTLYPLLSVFPPPESTSTTLFSALGMGKKSPPSLNSCSGHSSVCKGRVSKQE